MIWALDASMNMTDVVCDESGSVVSTALWEEAKMTCGMGVRMLRMVVGTLRDSGLRRAMAFGRVMLMLEERRHHHAPTALHLQLLGTLPSMQNKGLGAQIIEVGIARADMRGLPCYLESSNPKNVPFYERQGFVVLEECHPFEGRTDGDGNPVEGKGPVVTLMRRDVGGGKK